MTAMRSFTFAVGWEDSELFPEGLIIKVLMVWETLNSFLLDEIEKIPSCLVKICPAYIMQSVHWTYRIGLSIQQETKKQGQMTDMSKGKASL